jgi:RHS repeat-associated protein
MLPVQVLRVAFLCVCLCATSLTAQTVLVGDQAIESNIDSNAVGLAEAFPVTATTSGQVGSINLFLDESSASTKVYLGIYSDASGKPGALLTQGSATQLAPGTWNSVTVSAVGLTSGTAYWIAILGTTSGVPYFRDRSTTACQSQTSSKSNLTSLPSTWTTGKSWDTCYISAYAVSGTLPATVPIGNQAVESSLDKNPAEQAEAFPAMANATGSVGTISLYLDPTSGSGPVYVGLYADNNDNPGTLLGQGSTTSPVAGSWNQISIASSSITAGNRYWIAVLGTQATSPYFRDRSTTACRSQTSKQTTLTSLPATWSSGTSWSTCYISAYGLSAAGSPVLSISPSSFNFTALQGGANPTAANLSVTNTGTGTLSFTDSTDQAWLSATPTSGTAPQTVQVSATVGSLTAGTYTGHVTVTAAGATNSPAVATATFTVSPFVPPSITASASPAANANGWNDTSVTVTFTCAAGSYPVVSCTSPIVVSTQGANQVVTGTVTDTNGDTNTAKVTLNIDTTAPALSIASPANGAVLTSSPVSVSGSVSDARSGVASVTCDGAAATVQSGSYNCSVALNSGADTISVQATSVAGDSVTQSVSVTYSSVPGITSFSPPSGTAGTVVTVVGSNFAPGGFNPEVTLSQQGGGTIIAPISSFSSGTLSFVIPSGAATGPITVTVNGQSATSSSSLTVASSSGFTLAAGPSSVTLLPGQSAIVQVSLTSTNGFTQLAGLSVSGLPSGVTASFQPPQITEGGSSQLTLSAPGGQSPGSSTLTISASATVQGISQTQTAQVSLNVQAPSGSASFAGKVEVTGPYNIPLVGVTVSFTGTNYTGAKTGCTGSTTTDNGGNFLLNSLPSSCTGPQMIEYDPSTVTSPPGKYSGVTLSYVLTPGQTTTPGIVVHLPNVANAETFNVSQNSSQNQTFVSQTISGVTITIYAGTTLSLADGTQPDPFPLGIIEIPYNQVPDYMPPNPTEDPVFAMSIEPFNSSSSQPIAVSYPNRKNSLPGSNMPLTSLNPTLGMMVNYGTGTVSPDMTQVVPDRDPANPGHLYGISHFDWHFPLPAPNPTNPSPDPDCPCDGDPVDFGSGILVETKTDIGFSSARGSITLTRTYREMAATTGTTGISASGPFGFGTNHNYNVFMDTSFVSTIPDQTSVVGVMMPDGNEFWFTGQLGQTFITSSTPEVAGATFSNIQCGSNTGYGIPCSGTLRWRDGTIYQFQPLLIGQPWVGFLMSITDPNLNVTTIVHDQSVPSEIDRIVDPLGRALNFGYDSSYRITSITDPIGRTVSYSYNSIGKLATVTDPKGGITTYTYNALNQLSAIEDANHNTYQNLFDPNGRVIQQTAPDGGVTQFQYTLLNPNVATSPVVTAVVTDPRMNSTTYAFNPAGYLQSITDPMGNQTVYNVNSSTNQKTSVTDALQRTTQYTYDGNGNLASETLLEAAPSGEVVGGSGLGDVVGPTTTSYVYDPTFNKLTSMTDPLGKVSAYSYDGHGNLLALKDPMSRQISYGYDSYGEKTSVTDPSGYTTNYNYSNGFLNSSIDPMGRTTTYVNDGAGRTISVTTPLYQTTQYQYDPLNKVTTSINAAGSTNSYLYDPNENLLSLTDAGGNTTKFAYDSMNRLLSRTDALGHTQSYQYDYNGNVTQYTDRRGTVSAYSYDSLNRKTLDSYGSGNSVNYYYDAASRMTQAVDSITGPLTLYYDFLDRKVNETTANGSVAYAYDALGRRIAMQVSGQASVNYTYDPDNELIQITQNSASVSFGYDTSGRRTSLTLPNGAVTSYGYDADSEVTSLGYQLGNTSLGSLVYGYDSNGRRTSIAGGFAQTNLPTAASGGSANANDQLTQWNGNSLSYDANGNLLSDGTNNYTWDARNRLVAISGGVSASFKYDPFGRRVSKTIGAATTGYVYDGVNPVQELSSGVVSANMLVGTATDEFFQRSDSSGTAVFLRDAQGDTISLVGGSGATVAQYTYEPFGNTTATGTSTNPYQYTGRENDGTGLYYYRARYYKPTLGRFISEDPAGFKDGSNFYGYVRNNPVNLIDPLGECAKKDATKDCIAKAIAALFPGATADVEDMPDNKGETGGHWNFNVQIDFSSYDAMMNFFNSYYPPPGTPGIRIGPKARFGPGPALHLENLSNTNDWDNGDGTYSVTGTAHLDLYNPNSGAAGGEGIGGVAGHGAVDFILGHLIQALGSNIDPSHCPW